MQSKNNNQDFKLDNLFGNYVKGKVALVSGGSSGIGLMISQALAVNGATVYIFSRTKEKLENVVKKYNEENIEGKIVTLQGDITSKEDINLLVKVLEKSEKKLDILVNNAGIAGDVTVNPNENSAEKVKESLMKDTFENWEKVYRTNVTAAYFLTAACVPLLHQSTISTPGWSSTVLNISSISGLTKISQHHPAYNASKAAIIYLTKMLANEFMMNGGYPKTRVNSIAPGVFPSEMTTGGSDESQKSKIENDKYRTLPASRTGNDIDMAQAVLFAICCQYINSITIPVDGGYLIQSGQ